MIDDRPNADDDFTDVMLELARLRDEMHLKIHLAGMDVHDAWEALQPRLHELERGLEAKGTAAYRALRKVAEDLRDRLIELRDVINDTDGRGETQNRA